MPQCCTLGQADFSTGNDLAAMPGSHWVKRCKKRAIHEDCDQITGISFGSGNEVSARLYDKTREILKSGKDYMKPLWALEGWDGKALSPGDVRDRYSCAGQTK